MLGILFSISESPEVPRMAPVRLTTLLPLVALLALSSRTFAGQFQEPSRLPRNVLETPEPPRADSSEEPGAIQPVAGQVPMNPVPNSSPFTAPSSFMGEQLPTPAVSLMVIGPAHAQKEKEVKYIVRASNRSAADAYEVFLICPAPKGTTGVSYKIEGKEEGKPLPPDGRIKIGTLKMGASKQVEVVLKPEPDATDIKFVSKVTFEHGVVVQTALSKPGLVVHKKASSKIIRGVPFACRLELQNTGKVTINDILVDDILDEGLVLDTKKAPSPKPVKEDLKTLSWKIDVLKPGQTRVIEYQLIASGDVANSKYQVSANGVSNVNNWSVKVTDAKLDVALSSDNQRAMINTATPYFVMVKNTGTAELKNVLVNCSLPGDVKATRTSSGSQMFPDSVQWVLPSLKPQEEKKLRLTVEASKEGSRAITFAVRANPGQDFQKTITTEFYGSPTLNWTSEGTTNCKVGDDITGTITVKNGGDGPAKRVTVKIDLPPEIEFQEEATPAHFKATANGITFDALDLPAGKEQKFTFKAKAKTSGEALFKIYLWADHLGQQEPLHRDMVTNINGGAAGLSPAKP